jgi:hypothetical protein
MSYAKFPKLSCAATKPYNRRGTAQRGKWYRRNSARTDWRFRGRAQQALSTDREQIDPHGGVMATKLEKSLKRELEIDGQAYMITIAPEGLKITLKGHRRGIELGWKDLVTGQAALTTALNASLEQANG